MTTVTEAEFRINVKEMFKALDMDRNDSLDWTECRDLVKGVMKVDGGYDAETFKEKYDAMDKNQDGCISKAELTESVIAVGRERKLFIPDPTKKKEEPMIRKHEAIADRPVVKYAVAEDPAEIAVDAQTFRDGLSCLGKTFNNARHAYLKLNVNDRSLTTLKGIGRYKHLQYIDVSNNSLTTLTHLSNIKHLIKLNASNNRITKMLDFAPPANLEVVDYSHN